MRAGGPRIARPLLEGSGGMPPGKFIVIRYSEVHSGAF